MRREPVVRRVPRPMIRSPEPATRAALIAVLLLPLVSTSATLAQAGSYAADFGAGPADPDGAPKYEVLRYNEDWSFLAGKSREDRTGRFDVIKYVALDRKERIWASFGGQLRERVELWDNFGFNLPVGAKSNDIFLLHRLLVHADLHLGPNVRVFVEGKSSLATDRDLPGERRIIDVDEADLENAFVDLKLPAGAVESLVLRGGRQELLFGKERLIGAFDWANTRRTFDGFSMHLETSAWKLAGFVTALAPVEKYDFNSTDEDVALFGVYATTSAMPGLLGLDLYWLLLDQDDAAFNGSSGNEDRHTLGARAWGDVADTGLDFEGEFAYQFGGIGSGDISAFMVTAQVGAVAHVAHVEPRFELGFDYASGDDTTGDDDVETFNQLFPTGHLYLGYIDAVGRQNVAAVRGTAAVDFFLGSQLKADVYSFWRADDDDFLYNAAGSAVTDLGTGGSNHVGVELDLTLKKAVSRHTAVLIGYSHFFGGDFVERQPSSEDIDFGYLQLQYTI